ncbi:LytR/AlgR family response regulator transcription factor [Sphingobacterium deserti]|uniref:Two component transcriptional regulator, LytTR family n=1 Tax=Sphingobacterium deserti TaxID=1229276 RepID=A0A0B8TBI5_9SPHI|nr:LytTR family DNA-binding domain-containing protein [Sphingobacterium deserti]KGE15565.1 two component transcriptional regulator, LytTR family [Sphingobacterium deserti]
MKIIIIEDEDLTAEDLALTLKRIEPSSELSARLSSVKEAIAFLKSDPDIDLIFSDIQLGDGESFDIFREVSPKAPIVFCTAYNQYMLEAFQTFGLDYILKPFSDESILKTLEKYKQLRQTFNRGTQNMVDAVTRPSPGADARKKSLIVINGDKIIPIQLQEIALCYIEYENVFVKTDAGKQYLVNKSLEEMEQMLGGEFFRVNRQHIVKRATIAYANTSLSRKLILSLHVEHPIKISVSKEKYQMFMQWLQG